MKTKTQHYWKAIVAGSALWGAGALIGLAQTADAQVGLETSDAKASPARESSAVQATDTNSDLAPRRFGRGRGPRWMNEDAAPDAVGRGPGRRRATANAGSNQDVRPAPRAGRRGADQERPRWRQRGERPPVSGEGYGRMERRRNRDASGATGLRPRQGRPNRMNDTWVCPQCGHGGGYGAPAARSGFRPGWQRGLDRDQARPPRWERPLRRGQYGIQGDGPGYGRQHQFGRRQGQLNEGVGPRRPAMSGGRGYGRRGRADAPAGPGRGAQGPPWLDN